MKYDAQVEDMLERDIIRTENGHYHANVPR